MTAPITLKEYFASAGSAFTKADAETIGPQFEALAEQGSFSDDSVVEVARSTNSPLHRYFTWDDKKAAHERRLDQARAMMKAIKVRVLIDDRPRIMPAYRFATKAPEPKPAPRSYNVLHQDSAFAAKMATAAFDDLMAWRAKYAVYLGMWVDFAAAFRVVANQISELEDAGRPTAIDQQTDEAVHALLAWRDRFGGGVETWGSLVEQGQFVLDAIGEAEAIFLREHKPKERPCLQCGTPFQSGGIENRLCERCNAA